jgi:hypothetical protein
VVAAATTATATRRSDLKGLKEGWQGA